MDVRRVGQAVADLHRVKRGGGIDVEPGRGEKSVASAEAEPDHADLSGALRQRAQGCDLGADVVDDLIDVDALRARKRTSAAFIGPLHHLGLGVAVELIRGRDHETARRVPFGKLANHRLDPEDRRQQQDPGRASCGRQRNVRLAHGPSRSSADRPQTCPFAPQSDEAIAAHVCAPVERARWKRHETLFARRRYRIRARSRRRGRHASPDAARPAGCTDACAGHDPAGSADSGDDARAEPEHQPQLVAVSVVRDGVPAGAAGTIALGELTVNRLGFGAMRLVGPGVWGAPRDRPAALAVLRRAVELGVTLIDTADSYGPHVDEELIAEALHPYPGGLVIATKAGFARTGPGRWVPDGRPAHLRAAVEGSLRRLRLERIDLLQFHTPDPKVPYEESFGALAELQRAGKIRYLGVSNVDVDQLACAQRITTIVSVQNRLAADGSDDAEEEDVLKTCERERIAFLPWAPLGGGTLRSAAFDRVARAHDATPSQVALAYLLRRSSAIVPIPGTSSLAHLEENVAAAALAPSLTDDELAQISSV